jgi:UPF0716 protein FxsA
MGQFMGVALTLLWVIVTFIAGLAIMRYEGLNYMRRMMETETDHRAQRIETLVEDGMMPVFAGLLIAVPGPFTDIIGLLLIIPPVRHLWLRYLNYRGNIPIRTQGKSHRIIEGQYWRRKK